jgi:hypothetical protein
MSIPVSNASGRDNRVMTKSLDMAASCYYQVENDRGKVSSISLPEVSLITFGFRLIRFLPLQSKHRHCSTDGYLVMVEIL